MVNIASVGTVIIKVVKLVCENCQFLAIYNIVLNYEHFTFRAYVQVLNIIILVLYRTGYRGGFLGVGGTWNLNEEKNPDAEIVASGVFIGFFIYTVVILISYGFGSNHQKKTLVVSEYACTYYTMYNI